MDDGYDEAYEDRLFEAIDWPHAGLPPLRDRALRRRSRLARRRVGEQLHVRSALAARAGRRFRRELHDGRWRVTRTSSSTSGSDASPDITVASDPRRGIVPPSARRHDDEPDPTRPSAERACFGYSEHYADLRGRRFRGPGKPIHYVGRITSPAARRTKPRRLSAEMFAARRRRPRCATAGRSKPTPVPDELTSAFTEAVWRSLPWKRTTWLGRRIESAPTDLLAYQEIIAAVRPDWIVETGTGDGGRALFLASICELVGHGEVISVGVRACGRPAAASAPAIPRRHARTLPDTVHDPCGRSSATGRRDGRARFLHANGSRRRRSSRRMRRSSPVGSYVVVADTIVNGHPVWPAFGDGPAESVKQILTLPRRVRRRPEHGEVLAHLQSGRVPEAGALRSAARAGRRRRVGEAPVNGSGVGNGTVLARGRRARASDRDVRCRARRRGYRWRSVGPASRSGMRSRRHRPWPMPSPTWRGSTTRRRRPCSAEMLPVLEALCDAHALCIVAPDELDGGSP